MPNAMKRLSAKQATVAFTVIVAVWLILDRITKVACDNGQVGHVFADNVLGLFQFILVHNTGAAWGIFSQSTFALGIFSVIISIAVILWFASVARKGQVALLEVISLALVASGGLGNAIDRLAYGYVVDFINCTFIDFPVFNVADIGVTVGIALLMISLLLSIFVSDEASTAADAGKGE